MEYKSEGGFPLSVAFWEPIADVAKQEGDGAFGQGHLWLIRLNQVLFLPLAS